jgi:L-threonylcarbamoyladenylate synthase
VAVPELVVDPAAPGVLADAAAALRAGGLVSFPTETVYGLGGDATSVEAVRRIFSVKGRPATDPLIVHVPDLDAARRVVVGWDDRTEGVAQRFWPGPLTLVLVRSDAVVDAVGGGRPTVAVRIPAHPVALELLRAAGVPVAAPSANRFGRVSPTTAAHVVAELGGLLDPAVDLVLDGGPTRLGVESTVLDLTGDRPTVLRHGGVTAEDLSSVLDDVAAPERTVVPEDQAAAAPGTFLRHYSPATPVVLVEGPVAVARDLVAALAAGGLAAAVLDLPDLPDQAAAALYAALRDADGSAPVLVARTVAASGIGRAVNDRLFRAASGLVVTDAGAASVERVRRAVLPPTVLPAS